MTEKVDKARLEFFMVIFSLAVVPLQLLVCLVLGGVIQAAENKNKSSIFINPAVSLAISSILWTFVKEESVHPMI